METPPKKRNTNAQTEHSKKLRAESAKKFQQSLGSGCRMTLTHQNADVITAIRQGLQEISGKNQAEKIIFLIDFYKEKNNREN